MMKIYKVLTNSGYRLSIVMAATACDALRIAKETKYSDDSRWSEVESMEGQAYGDSVFGCDSFAEGVISVKQD